MNKKKTQRGMKKWAPFKSLEGQDTYVGMVKNKFFQEEKPELSDDQIENINYALNNYLNKMVKIHYFIDKNMICEGILNKILIDTLQIKVNQTLIPISSIIEIILIED